VQDILFVAIIVAFFGLAALLVRACELIIGPADEAGRAPAAAPAEPKPAEAAA